jgi:hypothetical protein
MKKNSLYLVFACAALAFATTVTAAKDWDLLGERVVSYIVDHDVISVGGYEGSFRKIGFKVEGNTVRFRKIVIHYENNSKQEINQNFRVDDGERSQAFDLAGKQRKIDRISIWYDTVGFDGRATVRAFGLR